MIAYLFWHRPLGGGEETQYEERLVAFHAALAAERPSGFHASAAARVAVPWLSGAGYEDWYLVEDWQALGLLNDAAVDLAHREPHDRVAASAGEGIGAVYALTAGKPDLDASAAVWLDKPRGTPYERFEKEMLADGAAVWQRQLVLGPTPEFCVLDPVEPPAGAERVERELVYPR